MTEYRNNDVPCEEKKIAAGWQAAANDEAVVKWYARLYHRKDVFARYGGPNGPACVKDGITADLIRQHIRGEITLGSYSTRPDDDSVVWMGLDIDAHDDKADPDANLKYALVLYERLKSLGIVSILEDSNGAGGFHLWVLFDGRIPAGLALSFGRWLTRDCAEYGVERVEVFPKQATVGVYNSALDEKVGYGNQLRLPGRHHKRDHYSRIWNDSEWAVGYEAIRVMISVRPTAISQIPREAREFIPPAKPSNGNHIPAEWENYEPGAGWMKNYNGDLRTLDCRCLFADRIRSDHETKIEIVCPWSAEHSTGDTGTAVWCPDGVKYPGFRCLHSHCADRKLEHVLASFGRERVDACCGKMFSDPKKLAEGQWLENAEAEMAAVLSKPTARPADPFHQYKTDPWYSYLWRGHHGEYVTGEERLARINSIRDVRKLIPESGIVPAYIRTVLPTTDATVSFHVAGAVALVAHLLNRRAWVKTGYSRTYPNLWVGCLGQSTKARKSSSINPVKHVLQQVPEYSRTILPDTFTFESLAADLGYVLEPDSPEPWEECRAKFDADPTTFLKGVGLFHVNEIGGFLQNMDRTYNQGGKAILTEWYDCPNEWRKSTRTQGSYYVWRPCVSILGASTLAWLNESCTDSDMKGGFLPRWLFFCGAEKDYHLSYQDSPREADEEQLHALVRGLIERKPAEMVVTRPALKMYDQWQRRFVAEIDPRLDSWGGRMVVHALKLGMVFEASTNPNATTITESSLGLATGLVDKLAADLTQLIETELAFGESDAKMKKVLSAIQKAGPAGIDHSSLSRKMAPMLARELGDILNSLIDQDRVKVTTITAGNRRQSHRYSFLR